MVLSPLSRLLRSQSRSRSTICSLAPLFFLGSQLPAQYSTFWERVEFQKNVRAALTYDSNITGNEIELDDTILSGSATVSVDQQFKYFRLGFELTGVAAQYFNYDQLNYQNVYFNWIIDASERLGGRRFTYSLNFDLREATDAGEETQGQATLRTLSAGVDGTYLVNRRISVGAGFDYENRSPQGKVKRLDDNLDVISTDSLFSTDTFTTSGWINLEQNEDLRYRLTARHRVFDSENDYQNGTSDGLDVSVRGQILAKLSGSLALGFESRSLDDGEDDTAPTVNASLLWTIDASTNLSLEGSHRYGTSINGSNSSNSRLALSLSRQISRLTVVGITTALTQSDYSFSDTQIAESDLIEKAETESDTFSIGGSISQRMTDWSTLSLNVNWTKSTSDFVGGDSNRLRGTLAFDMSF